MAAIVFNKRITYNNIEYPDWAVSLGWTSCVSSMLLIPFYMGYRLLYLQEGDLIEVIIFVFYTFFVDKLSFSVLTPNENNKRLTSI